MYTRLKEPAAHTHPLLFSCFEENSCNVTGLELYIGFQVAVIEFQVTVSQHHPLVIQWGLHYQSRL